MAKMMVYRTPEAAIRAAQRVIGGTPATYDGAAVLARTVRTVSGQVATDYLSAKDAARKAGIIYRPREE